MPIDDVQRLVLAELASLCERQTELSLATHLALMEAFNDLSDDQGAPAGSVAEDRSVGALLTDVSALVDVLVQDAEDLQQRVRFEGLRELVVLAIRAS